MRGRTSPVSTCSNGWQNYAVADPDARASFYREADNVGMARAEPAVTQEGLFDDDVGGCAEYPGDSLDL